MTKVKIEIVNGEGQVCNWTTIEESELFTNNTFDVIYDLFRGNLENGYEIVISKNDSNI